MVGSGLRLLPLLAALCGGVAGAAEPLWEAGVGVGLLTVSDYRGADTRSTYALPVPYFVYRGQFLRADREGVRGLLMQRQTFEFDVSVNATAPARSGRDSARNGMPDLDPTLELGPALQWHAWESGDGRLRLAARLPVRATFAIGDAGFIGWFAAPSLNLDLAGSGLVSNWNFGVLAGPLFADRRYHEYFHGVAAQFVTPQRSYYAASGGYSGSQLLVSATRRFPHFWIGGYARHDWLDGAVFANSPLTRRDSSWSAGLAIAWIVAQSSRNVPADAR